MSKSASTRTEMLPASPMPVPEWRRQVGVTEAQLAAAKRASDYWAGMGRSVAPAADSGRLN